ncbi:hypothetical protein [Peterkaempfera griseoplana]|uniref:hypothetical protein n=1 Tax=Peterkaempfera griseoplana TaxID=66896 RepID=UPI0006E3682C|nr:hypothetical protein [Peterkaempfera griseoplana]
MNGWDQQFQDALRGLAESAEQAAAPPLPPAQLRRHTERRHRRRIVLIPSAALAGLLAAGTAYGMAGGFRHEGAPPPAPVVTGPATAAPRTSEPPPSAGPDPAAATPSRPASGAPAPAGGPSRRAPATGLPSARPSTAGPGLPLPTALVSCPVAGAHEFLVRAKGLTLRDPLKGLAAGLEAVPVACVADPSAQGGGRLAPSGPVRILNLAPGAVLTTTAPISGGRSPVPASPAQLAAGLARHPDQIFGVRLDSAGRVTRLDQVYSP